MEGILIGRNVVLHRNHVVSQHAEDAVNGIPVSFQVAVGSGDIDFRHEKSQIIYTPRLIIQARGPK